MFKKYGLLGILMILFVMVNFYLKIEPFARWYFPIAWFGLIFIIDAIIYKLRNESLISSRFKHFLVMLILSAIIWWVYEFFNRFMGNWNYQGLTGFDTTIEKLIFGTISFATVLPAVVEVFELFKTLNLFKRAHLKHKHKITKRFLYVMTFIGVATLILPIILPKYFFSVIWLGFFFLMDPFNYLHKQPSIIQHLRDRKLQIPILIMLAALVCGFFWEFWNYYAIPKWTYSIPYVGFFKIFEMPILGYLGYLPFGLSLYSLYYFVKTLFVSEERLLHLKRRERKYFEDLE